MPGINVQAKYFRLIQNNVEEVRISKLLFHFEQNIRDYSFSMYAKLSEKRTSLSPKLGGKICYFFGTFCIRSK